MPAQSVRIAAAGGPLGEARVGAEAPQQQARSRSRSRSLSPTISWSDSAAMAQERRRQLRLRIHRLMDQVGRAQEELDAFGPEGDPPVPRCIMHRCGYCGVRVGDASHPGPPEEGPDTGEAGDATAAPGLEQATQEDPYLTPLETEVPGEPHVEVAQVSIASIDIAVYWE